MVVVSLYGSHSLVGIQLILLLYTHCYYVQINKKINKLIKKIKQKNSDMAPSIGEEFHTERVTSLGDGTCHTAHSWPCEVGCNRWCTLQYATWESSAPNKLKGFVIPTTVWCLTSHHAWLLNIIPKCCTNTAHNATTVQKSALHASILRSQRWQKHSRLCKIKIASVLFDTDSQNPFK